MNLVNVETSIALEAFRWPPAGVAGRSLRAIAADGHPAIVYADPNGTAPIPDPAYLQAPGTPEGAATITRDAPIYVQPGTEYRFLVHEANGAVVVEEAVGPLAMPNPRPKPAQMVLGNSGFMTEEI